MAELNRSELRKKIMTILYQISICENNRIMYDVNDLIKNILEIDNDFVKETVYGVITNREKIDEYANKYLNNWTLDRLGNTDQAILRMAIYELMYTDTPEVVVINEAVELAKLYSDDAVKGMINSVLDKIYKSEKNE